MFCTNFVENRYQKSLKSGNHCSNCSSILDSGWISSLILNLFQYIFSFIIFLSGNRSGFKLLHYLEMKKCDRKLRFERKDFAYIPSNNQMNTNKIDFNLYFLLGFENTWHMNIMTLRFIAVLAYSAVLAIAVAQSGT